MNTLYKIAVLLFAIAFLATPVVATSEEELQIVKRDSSGGVSIHHIHVEEHGAHEDHAYRSPFIRSRVTEISDTLTDESFIYEDYYDMEDVSSLPYEDQQTSDEI